jgi:LysR family glycine cleavage system transcriptional activator
MKSAVWSLRHAIPSLHSLALFEASARFLNFSKAAEELSITQPAVSHGIRQLERALGHPLFFRERRSLTLTPEGERLHASVSAGLSGIAETVEAVRREAGQRPMIAVGVSTSMAAKWLLPRLPAVRDLFPELALDIRCVDKDLDLATSGIDLVLRISDGKWPGYDGVALWPETIAAVCSPGYLDAGGRVAALGELTRHELIHYDDPFRLRLGWPEWLRALGAEIPADRPALLHDDAARLRQAPAARRLPGLALRRICGRPEARMIYRSWHLAAEVGFVANEGGARGRPLREARRRNTSR